MSQSRKGTDFLGCLFIVGLFGAVLLGAILGISHRNTIRVICVDGNKNHREIRVKGVFHPRNGEDIYPNDEAIKSRTILYNESDKDMILYSVRYNNENSSEKDYNNIRTGTIIKAGSYITIANIQEPDYWFTAPPSSIRIQTRNGQLSGAYRDVLDYVSSVEAQGFIVDKNGIIHMPD